MATLFKDVVVLAQWYMSRNTDIVGSNPSVCWVISAKFEFFFFIFKFFFCFFSRFTTSTVIRSFEEVPCYFFWKVVVAQWSNTCIVLL